ncbi:MAG: aquaporin, partial [Actinomycetota bacterium]
ELLGTAILLGAIVGSGIAVERAIPGEPGLQLLGNAAATALMLAAMIVAFGPVSGAHLNPVVTMTARIGSEVGGAAAGLYVVAQVAGATIGAIVANLMFGLPAATWSTTRRAGGTMWLSEALATFGLVLVVRLVGRRGRQAETGLAVGVFVGAAIVFTPSTCFANPAVTLARMLSDTFTGIAPSSVPLFLTAQVAGALGAMVCERIWTHQDRVPAIRG